MNKITELRNKRAKAWEDAKAFLEKHRGEDGIVSAENNATYEKMEGDIVNLGREIERLERQAEIDIAMAKNVSTPIVEQPGTPPKSTANTGTASPEYSKAFWNAMLRGKSVYNTTTELNIGENSEGGYLVPDEFERTIVDGLQENNVVRRIANIIRTSSGTLKIPTVATHGTASWTDESGAITPSYDSFGQATLTSHKMATTMKVTSELLNDSAFNVQSYIAKEFGRRFGVLEEAGFISGDGDGKPTGFLDSTSGAATGVTTAAATAITADELIDLFYSLKSPYRRKAVWLVNDATLAIIRKLKDGAGNYLWTPSIQAGQPDRVLGCPIYTSPSMPKATAGLQSAVLGDFSYYWIADRVGRTFKRLDELYAINDEVGFVATQRVDGKLLLKEALTVLKQHA